MPDGKTGGFGDRVNRTGNRRSMIHFVRRDIRHTVRVVDDLFRLRVQPAVAFDQTDAVRRSAADPRLADEICVASKSIRILCQLCFKQALGQYETECAPDVAPMLLISMERILHQIVGVLGGWVREAGRVQFRAAGSHTVVDLDRAARCAAPVAAVGIARNHRVDVRGIFFILVGYGSAELDCKIFIRCRQREGDGGGIGFLLFYNASVFQFNGHGSYSLFRDKKAIHEAVCRALARRGLAKAEGIKNRLDLYRVKTIAVGHSRVGFRHRRIQKGKSRLHICNVRSEFVRHTFAICHPIKRGFHSGIVVVGPTRRSRAEDGRDQDNRRENGDQQKADTLAPLFAGQQCGGDLYEHRRYCHQRPPAFPNRASLYGGAWTSSRYRSFPHL